LLNFDRKNGCIEAPHYHAMGTLPAQLYQFLKQCYVTELHFSSIVFRKNIMFLEFSDKITCLVYRHIYIYVRTGCIQVECARLWESVPYVNLYDTDL